MIATAFVVSWAAMSRMGLGSLSQTVHCILINPLTIPHDVPLPSKNTSWQSPGLWHTTPCQSSIYIVAYGLLKKYNRESLSNSNKSHSANPKWSNGPWFWIRIGVLLTWNPHDQIVMFITTTDATYHHGGWASTWFKNSSYWQQGQLPSCSLFVETTQMTYLDNNSTYGWISEWGCFQGTCNLVVLILVYSDSNIMNKYRCWGSESWPYVLTTSLYGLIIPLGSPSHKVRQGTVKRVEIEAACELFASLSHCRYRHLLRTHILLESFGSDFATVTSYSITQIWCTVRVVAFGHLSIVNSSHLIPRWYMPISTTVAR